MTGNRNNVADQDRFKEQSQAEATRAEMNNQEVPAGKTVQPGNTTQSPVTQSEEERSAAENKGSSPDNNEGKSCTDWLGLIFRCFKCGVSWGERIDKAVGGEEE